MLTSYSGIVKKGQIQLQEPVTLPEGAQVLVVIELALSEVEAQERRLAALSASEWQAPFNAFAQSAPNAPVEVDIDSVDDQELVDLIHEVRSDRKP
jgi:hypothetical protein